MNSENNNIFSKLLNRRTLMGASISTALFFVVLGILFWGGFNWAMESTNTLTFCISCHEMEENVYAEYKGTIHDSNRSGVRASCSDCHVPKEWHHKVVRKIRASYELFHKVAGTINTKEKFEAHRLTMAKRVWKAMKETDSRECRNCHEIVTMDPEFQKPRARKQHLNAMRLGHTCIDCHKGIAHKKVHHLLSDEELEEMEKPNPKYIRAIPDTFIAYINGKNSKKKKSAPAKQETTVAEVVGEEEEQIVETVVAEQPEKAVQETVVAQASVAKAETTAFNWDKSPERVIDLLYPGQSSMEWIFSSDHSGKRAFKTGDRCFDCHDEEIADMGELIVSGEKLEPNVIPGKRGSIPVKVRAGHDGEYLYMRFQWPDAEHAPAPFVDGGKMDPDNQIKLALMFSTDDVLYADRAGCWGTCHHDAKDMPHAPDSEGLAGVTLELDLSNGVSKYITESRTKIELRGRRGKKLGGWDKLKEKSELQVEFESNRYMDLLRYEAGTQKTEDGHILAERIMEGGQGAEFAANLEGGEWTVTMKRKLQSDKSGDINLAVGQIYNIGFAIHDDYSNSRYHHVSLGYKLGFDNEDTEINAVKQ